MYALIAIDHVFGWNIAVSTGHATNDAIIKFLGAEIICSNPHVRLYQAI